ncbi:transport and Golgi organization protein 1 homolog isoform X8 [Acinonyx jubatus]|uniref:Transport and Golgi organization protein 1 homolog isoform X8 n=1 Tax=Acinonyx jubatus TaxID=32536 RepID=A0ABM3PD65_ACIJB|nr:transport and Golgi organization protein 1 homolog isoform X8 [Acinonyx jubatus]
MLWLLLLLLLPLPGLSLRQHSTVLDTGMATPILLKDTSPGSHSWKLGLNEREQVEGEKQLSAAEETLKLAAEELWNYKRRVEETQEQLQQSELTFGHQITLCEKVSQDNWGL